MSAVQNASSTSVLIATYTYMRACTTALVVRVSAVCLDRDAIVCIIQVLIFFFWSESYALLQAFWHTDVDGNIVR
jgi:hypothetical protein